MSHKDNETNHLIDSTILTNFETSKILIDKIATIGNKGALESIQYPVNIFGDVKHTKRIAIDIGGSLVKLVYLVNGQLNSKTDNPENSSCHGRSQEYGRYHMRFIKFETKYIENCLGFIQKHYMANEKSIPSNIVYATGGGSIKYRELIKNKLGLELQKYDEIDCIIKGSIFLIKNIKNECFQFDREHFPSFIYQESSEDSPFPFLLANIGSGVSFIKVESEEKYERVGGTSLGGGTFWGIGSLLTNANSFDELINFASEGSSENVDMLVKDIYGGDYELLNLPKSLIASSFGKCSRSWFEKETYSKTNYSDNDIARSLLRMISYNIGQLAVLYATVHGVNRIYFGGYFIRNNFMPILTISEAVGFFSQAKFSALFFKHDGFLGALGAFYNGTLLEKEETNINLKSDFSPDFGYFEENIATSSFATYSVAQHYHPIKILSLDFDTNCTTSFPLLISGGHVSLDRDFILELVNYIHEWIPLFVREFKKQYGQEDEKCQKMCANFTKMIEIRLDCYRSSDPLKILNYLNDILYIQDRFIKQFLVLDPLLNFKNTQNQLAINKFKSYLELLDSIPGVPERHSLIFDHWLAGNLVDFSSNEVLNLLDSDLTHDKCLNIIAQHKRCYTGGNFSTWVDKFNLKKWRKVLFFADNCGFDLIFGICSLAREFIQAGSQVILAANTSPSFNDVLCSELSLIVGRLRNICPIINKAFDSLISFVQTGFSSPYLNLQSTNPDLSKISNDVDLIIVDGQSRSLISHFDAKFSCDVMYIGTATSKIFSQKCGLHVFDTFIKFDFLK